MKRDVENGVHEVPNSCVETEVWQEESCYRKINLIESWRETRNGSRESVVLSTYIDHFCTFPYCGNKMRRHTWRSSQTTFGGQGHAEVMKTIV